MQELSNNHNSIETIEIIEAINSTDPKVNDTPYKEKTPNQLKSPKRVILPTPKRVIFQLYKSTLI
jgi:hypothetical protein